MFYRLTYFLLGGSRVDKLILYECNTVQKSRNKVCQLETLS